jgi:hypothetical protein
MDKFDKVIQKYFRDEYFLHFYSSDIHNKELGDPYIRYKIVKDYFFLYLGGQNIEETLLKVCSEPDQVEKLITAIIYW